MKRRSLAWLVLSLLVVAALGTAVVRAVHKRQAQQQAASTAPAAVALELTPADLLGATRGELSRTLEVSGGLRAVNSALVKARVAGEVREITVREGDAVQAGQVLVRLDPSEHEARLRQAQQNAAAARAQAEIARRTLQNNQALVAQGFISRNALETAESNAAAARASAEAADAAADLARKVLADTVLRAPLAGRVSQRLVQPGERVGVDARLVELLDVSRLELEAALPPQDALQLRPGAAARLTVEGWPEPLPARVARINPATLPGSRAVPAYLTLDNPGPLRAGLFARGVIELERREVLHVPLAAVRSDQPRPYVLLIEDGRVQQRGVRLGLRGEAGGEAAVEIVEGLQGGERLLRGSLGSLRPGTPVRLVEAARAPADPR
ncbi:efflux RND transporter periplasmic adaptor subunit [Caldimonas tepidiphila]|uniref:efflux RND transporter periplasmic adaptor subunit n=1 Tax=Caldimonas tepidiphila TaxID=2315841 RepID=UPI000E5B5FCC|nr:efflux RND transporter periplasmic adaptor subunit [Caldimonas tepidiphila]